MMIDSLKKEADYYETCEIYNKNGTVNGELTLEFFRVSFLLSVIENSKGKESNSSYMHLQKGIYNFLFTEVSEESCERKREWV
uniref:Uncharacterized protein n=2 Tax=Caenorhabditis tropicalis TaxID=1561998 RepID=A0A1I7SYF2_9PELO